MNRPFCCRSLTDLAYLEVIAIVGVRSTRRRTGRFHHVLPFGGDDQRSSATDTSLRLRRKEHEFTHRAIGENGLSSSP